jgi:hypothetical protein
MVDRNAEVSGVNVEGLQIEGPTAIVVIRCGTIDPCAMHASCLNISVSTFDKRF